MFFTKKWTNQSLRDALADRLGPDYRIVFDAQGIGVKNNGALIAYIELTANQKEATVAFSVTCWPGFAAELALVLESQLTTYVDAEVGFVASEMRDIRKVH